MGFQVDEILEGDVVTGRNCGEDIPIGTVFSKIVKYKFTGPVSELERIELGMVSGIELTLMKVSWYHREVECIPAGHTAGIRLEGKGLSTLRSELKSLAEREYINISVGEP